jgi:hypothetical protein
MPIDHESVTTIRDDASEMQDRWTRVSDVYEGSDVIKAKGVKYLPRVSSEMSADAYNAYKSRALFFNGMKPTVEGLTGMVFRKPLDVQRPDVMARDLEAMFADVNGAGDSLTEFAQALMRDHVLKTGRAFLWLDMPQQATANGRPYWRMYAAEQFINWKTETRDGRDVLVLAVLREIIEVDGDDEFTVEPREQYRVLRLTDNRYTVQLYTVMREGTSIQSIVAGPVITPLSSGTPLSFIPALVVNADGLGPLLSNPPLLDLADVNLSHYQSSADLEHGRHMTGLPTPWVVGAPKGGRLLIGSGAAWILEGDGAKAGMLEFTGQGLSALENALKDKEAKMARLGSRPVEGASSRAGVEAAETVRLRQSAETASLSNIANVTSRAITQLARWSAWWAHLTPTENNEDILVTLNTDFLDSQIDPAMLREMVNAVGTGVMSFETFWYNLQRGELTPPDVTPEEEQERINAGELNDTTTDTDPNATDDETDETDATDDDAEG